MARATNDVREVNFMFSPGFSLVIGSLNFLILPLFVAPRIHPSLIITPAVFVVAYIIALRHYLGTLRGDSVAIFAGQLRHRGLVQARSATASGGRVLLEAIEEAEVSGRIELNVWVWRAPRSVALFTLMTSGMWQSVQARVAA